MVLILLIVAAVAAAWWARWRRGGLNCPGREYRLLGFTVYWLLAVFFSYAGLFIPGFLIIAMALFLAPFRHRLHLLTLLAAFVVPFLIQTRFRAMEMERTWAAKRAEHPLVQLDDRLAALRPAQSPGLSEGLASQRHPYDDPLRRAALDQFRDNQRKANPDQSLRHDVRYRHYALEALHSNHRNHFVIAAGFGPARMFPVARDAEKYVDLPSVNPPPQPGPQLLSDESTPDGAALPPKEENPSPETWSDFNRLQTFAFANEAGWGWIKDEKTKTVAGFQPHGFRQIATSEASNLAAWKVDRVELISLLKSETPAAYVSEKLPAMDELKEAPTRPLDAFETDAVAKLRTGDETVIKELRSAIRMVGAIRADKDCLQCHQGSAGGLLGAFSYRIVYAGEAAMESK